MQTNTAETRKAAMTRASDEPAVTKGTAVPAAKATVLCADGQPDNKDEQARNLKELLHTAPLDASAVLRSALQWSFARMLPLPPDIGRFCHATRASLFSACLRFTLPQFGQVPEREPPTHV